MIAGNNGVLTKATDAKKANEQGTDADRVRLATQAALIDGEGTINTTATSGKGSLYAALVEEFGSEKVSASNYSNGEVTLNGKVYTVTTTGSVTVSDATAQSGSESGSGQASTPIWSLTDSNSNELADIGEVVTYGTEEFYVIGGDTVGTATTSSTENIILLAKYNLKKENNEITLKQDTGVGTTSLVGSNVVYSNACAFCSSTTWSESGANTTEGENFNNNATISSDSTSALYKAMAYGESLGATGRLMLKSEADTLRVSATSAILYGEYSDGDKVPYWLGTGTKIDGGQQVFDSGWNQYVGATYTPYTNNSKNGVRPLVVVSKSSIEV